ncbi:MAG: tyrosine-type recombinase/integrase [Desulfuromonadales bacterium]|nr:tyrosine-type recombinase/integrase [Desulfuromonadales bacterium]
MTDIRKPFERACVDGDVPNFRIHDLRHSFCALPVLNGGTLYEAQQLLGHKDSATTLRYAHLSQDALKVATEKVAAQIDKVGGV